MKKHLLKIITAVILAAMLVASAILFTACGSVSKNDFLPIKATEGAELKTSEKITFGANESVSFDNVILKDDINMLIVKNTVDNTYGLYDLKEQKFVTDGTKDYTSISYEGNGIFWAEKEISGETKCGILDAKGKEIIDVKHALDDVDVSDDAKIVRELNKYYKVEKDKTLPIADADKLNCALGSLSNVKLYGDYIYEFDGGSIIAYNLNGEFIKKFNSEPDSDYFILNVGNILKMKDFQVPSDSTDYTYFNGADKYKVVYEVYNLKNNSSKTVNFKYYIQSVKAGESWADSQKEYYSENFFKTNVVSAYEIKDKRLITSLDYAKYLAVNSSLQIEVDKELCDIYMLEENRYLHASLTGGNSYIKEKGGKIVATLGSNLSIYPSKTASGLIVVQNGSGKYGAIDFDGKTVVEFEYTSLTGFFGGGALGFKDGNYYQVIVALDKNDVKETKIENCTAEGVAFYKITTDNKYYSSNGTEMFTANSIISTHKLSDGSYFFRINNSGNTEYWLVY